MKSQRSIIASIFLALFCMIQLADVHVFSHDADDTNCAFCVMASDNAADDHFTPTHCVDVPQPIVVPADQVRTIYMNSYFASSINYSLLNKAPPTI